MEYTVYQSIGYYLTVASRKVNAFLNQRFIESGSDITFEQWVLLLGVKENPNKTLQYLADHMQKDKAGVYRQVKLMEKKGFLLMVENAKDSRKSQINLTDDGHRIVEQLKAVEKEAMKLVHQGIADDVYFNFKKIIQRVEENVDNYCK